MINTNNNSKEMNTIVETFIIEETVELIYDNEKLDEWNNYVKELGLSGQTKITKPEKSPIPFMHLKAGMIEVFKTLCPMAVNVSKYDCTPIPVEILSLISLSTKEMYFNRIEIWYDQKNIDPACIGVKSDYYLYDGYNKNVPKELCINYSSKEEAKKIALQYNPELGNGSFGWETNERYYLIGKWADVKHSFEDLKEMAKKRYMDEKGNDLRKTIKDAERGLIDLETSAFDLFN